MTIRKGEILPDELGNVHILPQPLLEIQRFLWVDCSLRPISSTKREFNATEEDRERNLTETLVHSGKMVHRTRRFFEPFSPRYTDSQVWFTTNTETRYD